jgi:hypothetical protein
MTRSDRRHYWFAAAFMPVFLLAVAVLPANAAKSRQAVVVSFTGQAEYIDTNEQKHPLARGAQLTAGQAVVTGEDGYVVLSLDDGSRIEVFADSRLLVNELWTDEEKQGFSMSLLLGHIHLKLKKVFAPDMVVTPTMVAGVRGTEFTATVADDGASVISVAQGQVNVATHEADDRFKTTDLKAGQEVELDEPGRVPQPRKRKIDSPQAAQDFIKDRFRKMLPRLPQITARMGRDIEKALKQLTGLTEAIEKKSAHIQALAKRLRESRTNRKQANKIKEQLKKEIGQLWWLGRAFKNRTVRMRSQFARLERLAHIRPRLDGKLPPDDLAQLDDNLQHVMSRKPEFSSEAQALYKRAIKAIEPVQGMLNRAKKAKPGSAS